MGIPELDTATLKIAVYLSEWMHPHDLPFYIPPDSFSPRFGTQFFSIKCTGWDILKPQTSTETRREGGGGQEETEDTTTTTPPNNSSKYVVYIFKISRGRQENVVRIRYSELLEFRNLLMSVPVIGGERIESISFPQKCYAPWNKFRACVLNERVEYFNSFLNQMFRVNLLFPGLLCIRSLFGFDHFDVADEWWKETGYGAIRKNTFNTPRVIRKTNDMGQSSSAPSCRTKRRMCSECAMKNGDSSRRRVFQKKRRRSADQLA